LGYYHLESDDTQKALDYLYRAISVEPTLAKAYENRARVTWNAGTVLGHLNIYKERVTWLLKEWARLIDSAE
jgi:hypothetical protein